MEIAGVRLTHPDRVLFAGQGLTKRTLAAYYAAVAERILPHLAARPVSLLRCPRGSGEPCFLQRHAGPGLPDAIRPVRLGGDEAPYLLLDGLAGLVSAVQLGTLELHVWGARSDAIERPDRLVLDLDPDAGVGFRAVRDAALALRDRLAAAGLGSFPLLTGSKGIHVLVPLAPRHDWATVKTFARGLAEAEAQAHPERFTTNIRKAAREGRIFIDHLRNDRGNTAIAPWSTRARAGAPVAMPVRWEELPSLARADAFTVATAAERAGTDPWAGWQELRQSLPPAATR